MYLYSLKESESVITRWHIKNGFSNGNNLQQIIISSVNRCGIYNSNVNFGADLYK